MKRQGRLQSKKGNEGNAVDEVRDSRCADSAPPYLRRGRPMSSTHTQLGIPLSILLHDRCGPRRVQDGQPAVPKVILAKKSPRSVQLQTQTLESLRRMANTTCYDSYYADRSPNERTSASMVKSGTQKAMSKGASSASKSLAQEKRTMITILKGKVTICTEYQPWWQKLRMGFQLRIDGEGLTRIEGDAESWSISKRL